MLKIRGGFVFITIIFYYVNKILNLSLCKNNIISSENQAGGKKYF